MRIKKVLALVLALAMALSMVSFAAFNDQDQIDTDLADAVELVSALGILQGDTNGNFNPKGTLTRAEAATILYRLSSGKATIDSSWADASLSKYADVVGHWSAPYVNYCAALGLISGYTDGTYRPNNKVTAAEMAKMLLNVAGYDTAKQGYGSNWPMSVLADATTSDLLLDYDAAFTGYATREWVAKMLANLIMYVNTVSYNAFTNTLVKDATTFGEAKYNVKSVEGIATANFTLELGGSPIEKVAAVKFSVIGGGTQVSYNIPTALLGHNVKVYYKATGAALGTANKIYAVVDASTTKTVAADKLYTKSGYLYVDGVKGQATGTYPIASSQYVSLAQADFINEGKALNDAREVTLVDNNKDGNWDAAFVNTVTYTKVNENKAANNQFDTVTVGNWEVAGGTTTALKTAYGKLNFVDTIAKNDYVAIETSYATGKLMFNVTKINALRTKLASVIGGEKFTVGATTYVAAATTADLFNFATTVSALDKAALKENTYDVYALGNYVVHFEKYAGTATTADLTSNVAYLIASKDGSEGDSFTSTVANKVQVMMSNGSVAIYDYKTPTSGSDFVAYSAIANKGTTAADGTVYEYVLNDDGTMYFKVLAAKEAGTVTLDATNTPDKTAIAINATATKSYITVNSKKVFFDANSYFFVKLTKDTKAVYTVVKGSELAAGAVFNTAAFTMVAKTAYSTSKTTGLNTLIFGCFTSTADKLPAASSTVTAVEYFITTAVADEIITADGSTWTVEGINANGEKQTLVLTSNLVDKAVGVAIAENTMYTIKKVDAELYLGKMGTADIGTTLAAGWVKTQIKAVGNGFVLLGDDSVAYDLTSDCTVTYVYDKSGVTTLKTTDLPKNMPRNVDVYVFVKSNSATSKTVSEIIIGVKSASDNTGVAIGGLVTYDYRAD